MSQLAVGPNSFVQTPTRPYATALFARYNSGYAIALYILACAVVSLISAAMLTDYTNKDISLEYDEPAHIRPTATPAE